MIPCVLVIGDIMLDKYIYGESTRLSPEAPVPTMRVQREEMHIGGSGNVALNLKALGLNVLLVGMVGNDSYAKTIESVAYNEMNIDKDHNSQVTFIKCKRRTIAKTRIIAQKQQVCRLDEEDSPFEDADAEKTLIKLLQSGKILPSNDVFIEAIVISDYGKGTITKDVLDAVRNIPSKYYLLDTKTKLYNSENFTIIKPTLRELASLVGDITIERLDPFVKDLADKNNSAYLVTRSEEGMSLYQKDKDILHMSATDTGRVVDVSGAGDTVIATLCKFFMKDLSLEDSMKLANIAAGTVVERPGCVPVNYEEFANRVAIYAPELMYLV